MFNLRMMKYQYNNKVIHNVLLERDRDRVGGGGNRRTKELRDISFLGFLSK